MNERIRELRRQATLVETYTTNSGAVAEGKHVDFEKFAELIINECAKFVEQDQFSSDPLAKRRTGRFIARLKNHFGVK